jgi:hypothetical protein
MSHRSARMELDPQTTWKARKLIKRQKETLREVQDLKKDKDMQQSEIHESKNKP